MIDHWYINLLREMMLEVPHLEMLCIMTEPPFAYKAVRGDSGLEVGKCDSRDGARMFPFGLE